MKMKTMLCAVTLLLGGVFTLPAGATTPMPASASGLLTVKVLPDSDVEIVQTTARQEGGNLIVDGHLQRKQVHGRVIPKGHVDIAIHDQHGKTIHQTFTRVSPEILPRMNGVKASFLAQIPVQVPEGSLVRVKFHCGPHDS